MGASFPNQIVYGFIVDTTEYAGGFEREMCAWITGQTGECGKGGDEADLALEQLNPTILKVIRENITGIEGDDGCLRPCSIWPTPGFHNIKGEYFPNEGNHPPLGSSPAYFSVIIFFRNNVFSNVELMRVLKDRAHSYTPPRWHSKINITGFRAQRIETVTHIRELTILS